MTSFINSNGMRTAIINLFIDPQNGFLDSSLEDKDGGNLYVPGGEEVIAPMKNLIEKSRHTIFIISQDYHPRTHINFMANHPGVMNYHTGGSFPEIIMDENWNIFGLKEQDGRIRQVRVETSSGFPADERDRGRITKVLDDYHPGTLDKYHANGKALSIQTLWATHCVQGTKSSLYPDSLNFPQGLQAKIEGDLMSKAIYHCDSSTGNEFWVIRKGMNSEIDSSGAGVENDGNTLTEAWNVFAIIAEKLKVSGCQRVVINGGGIATNICAELSMNNVVDFLAGHFKMRDMETQVNFVPEISRGIPISGGPEVPFSLSGTEPRLAKRGIGTVSVDEILSMTAPGTKQSFPTPKGM